jgi:hypothetical protein
MERKLPHLSKDQIDNLPLTELEAVVNSTNPTGRYGQEFIWARDELARRLLNGANYKTERARHRRLEDHDVLVARGEAEPL